MFSIDANAYSYEKLTLQSFHCIHTNLRYCVRSGCPFGQFNEVRDADIFIYATGSDINRVKHNVDFDVGESWKRYDLRKATSTMTPADTVTDAERAEKAFETRSKKQRSNALDAAITSGHMTNQLWWGLMASRVWTRSSDTALFFRIVRAQDITLIHISSIPLTECLSLHDCSASTTVCTLCR
jgi:hypothetical protein